MGLNHNRPMIARVAAFLLWALAAGSAVFWGLRLAAQPLPVPAQAVPASVQVGSASAVSRMLGAPHLRLRLPRHPLRRAAASASSV